jgi:hypothetical protein
MLNSGKKFILSLVLSEKIFLNETKNHNPPLQVKWSFHNLRKLSLNINKSFYSSSQVLAPNQHIQKHKFDWFDVTRQLLEYNPGTYQGLKMSSVEQPLTYSSTCWRRWRKQGCYCIHFNNIDQFILKKTYLKFIYILLKE